MDGLMRAAAVLATGAIGLTGCAGRTATAGHPTAAPSASNTADVQALWGATLEACPASKRVPTVAPADPYNLGITSAWPTEDQVSSIITGLHPTGPEDFTRARLVELRVALSDTRDELNQTAASVGTQLSDPAKQANADAIRTDNAESVRDTGSSWKAAEKFLVSEIDSGKTQSADANTAYIMRQVTDLKEKACAG